MRMHQSQTEIKLNADMNRIQLNKPKLNLNLQFWFPIFHAPCIFSWNPETLLINFIMQLKYAITIGQTINCF